jgi:membrane fusion protein, multidrug efflux system
MAGTTQLQRNIGIGAVIAVIVGVVAILLVNAPQRPSGGPGGPGGGRQRGDAAVPVLVAEARLANVPVYLDGVGTTKALNTVTVRPQVDGKIMSIQFKEGQDVQRGDVLAQIDPATYQAQFDQAVAKKAQDSAQLANARRDLERYTHLAQSNAIAKQQADTQVALVAQLEAQVKQDQAAIDNTQAILGYTTITAPIAGRTGIRMIDVGNLVQAASSTGLVVITQIRPISIIFTLPQQQFTQVNQAQEKGALAVEALGADNRTVIDRGTLRVIDNQVDQTTGTLRFKAEFPNADLQLWPGQFANVRLLVDTLKDAVVIPTAAVQRGPNGTFVFAVSPNDIATVRSIQVSQQDDTQAVASSGLQVGERVITTGFNQLADGTRIVISNQTPGDQPARQRKGVGLPQSGDVPRNNDAAPPIGQRSEQRGESGSAGPATGAAAGPAP